MKNNAVLYNLKTKVIQMGTMVTQMHTNGVLKVAYEKPSILHMRWAGETYVTLWLGVVLCLDSVSGILLSDITSSRMGDHPRFLVGNPLRAYTSCYINQPYPPPQ